MKIVCLLMMISVAQWLVAAENPTLNLLPTVKKIVFVANNELRFTKQTGIKFDVSENLPHTEFIREQLNEIIGSNFSATPVADLLVAIQIVSQPDKNPEYYELVISPRGIDLTANTYSGIVYGLQTLKQLAKKSADTTIFPEVKIIDEPAFMFRGFMHDTGRNFQEIADLKAQIDIFALYKLNIFHWHLTDNPAWRVVSKKYPQLASSIGRQDGRDSEKSYTFDEVRELFLYAQKRGILIIPELDMPGHSAFFPRVFGFPMASEQGIAVLQDLIAEFCREIPTTICPVLHIGSDEVEIKNPEQFMRSIEEVVVANGRTPMIWFPGLKPTNSTTILQLWADGESAEKFGEIPNPLVDSAAGYLNAYNPQNLVQRHFFHQICGVAQGNFKYLGGIICCWPDVRVDDKSKIITHNSVYPTLLAFAEAAWSGGKRGQEFINELPITGEAWTAFIDFEKRLLYHRDNFLQNLPFDYISMAQHRWLVNKKPFDQQTADAFSKKVEQNSGDVGRFFSNDDFREICGGSFLLNHRQKNAIFPAARKQPQAVYFYGEFTLEQSQEVYLRIGFESPTRSNRYCGGIPPVGKLDANNSEIFIDGQPLPRIIWQNPNKFRYLFNTWEKPENEIPYIDEEFFWLREPVSIKLTAGKHTIVMRCPTNAEQNSWAITFLPVKKNKRGQWTADETITIKSGR